MKMARKQVIFAPRRLVSHPVFFLFRLLFLFSTSSLVAAVRLSPLITITVMSCSVLQVHKAKLTDMFDATRIRTWDVYICKCGWLARGFLGSPQVWYVQKLGG